MSAGQKCFWRSKRYRLPLFLFSRFSENRMDPQTCVAPVRFWVKDTDVVDEERRSGLGQREFI
jgi:hypothetical protein